MLPKSGSNSPMRRGSGDDVPQPPRRMPREGSRKSWRGQLRDRNEKGIPPVAFGLQSNSDCSSDRNFKSGSRPTRPTGAPVKSVVAAPARALRGESHSRIRDGIRSRIRTPHQGGGAGRRRVLLTTRGSPDKIRPARPKPERTLTLQPEAEIKAWLRPNFHVEVSEPPQGRERPRRRATKTRNRPTNRVRAIELIFTVDIQRSHRRQDRSGPQSEGAREESTSARAA